MPKPLSKIVPGTIGNKPCEISLCKILVEHDDAVLTGHVMRVHQEFVNGARGIVASGMNDSMPCDWNYTKTILLMWRDRSIAAATKKFEDGRFPEVVYTHLRCCISAEYREQLRKLKGDENG